MELFVFVYVILFMAIIAFSPFWLPWLFGNLKQAIEQARTRKLLQSWGISLYNYNPGWQPMVYSLNSSSKILSMKLLEFSQLRMPASEMPNWWILRLGINPEKYEDKDEIRLIRDGHIDNNHWHFVYGKIAEEESYLMLRLYDRDDKTAMVSTEDKRYENLFAKVLEVVSTYSDVNDAWIRAIQKEGVPVLLETKGSMGKSPKIAALRHALENGPTIIFKFGESILPEAFLDAA